MTRLDACEGKAKFRSFSEAARTLKRMLAKGERALEVYRCRHCGYWHIGSNT